MLSTPRARRYSLRLTTEGDGQQLGSAFKDVSVPPLPSRLISPSSSSSARSDHTPLRRFSLRLSSESGFGSGFFGSDLPLQEPRQIPKESPIRVSQEEPPQPPPLPPRRSVEGEERGRSIDEARGNFAEQRVGPITRGPARRSAQVTLKHTGRGCGGCEEERDVDHDAAASGQVNRASPEQEAVAPRVANSAAPNRRPVFPRGLYGCFKSLRELDLLLLLRAASHADRHSYRMGQMSAAQLSKRVRGSRLYHLKGGLRVLLVDPGRINFISAVVVTVTRDFEVTFGQWQIVDGESYQRFVSSYQEMTAFDVGRRQQNQDYANALETLKGSRKRVANLELYKEYAKASFRAFPAMLAEMSQKKRLALRFRAQCDRRMYLDHLVGAFMKMDPDLVFYGNGRVNHARGSPCVATKKAMRAFGRRVATVVFHEGYTSSRCPHCQVPRKTLRREEHPSETIRTRDRTGQPTFQQESNPSGSISSIIRDGHQTSDVRWEHCDECSRSWPHDAISLRNFAAILVAFLKGEERPAYLTRPRASASASADRSGGSARDEVTERSARGQRQRKRKRRDSDSDSDTDSDSDSDSDTDSDSDSSSGSVSDSDSDSDSDSSSGSVSESDSDSDSDRDSDSSSGSVSESDSDSDSDTDSDSDG